jgi:hypothetical protein
MRAWLTNYYALSFGDDRKTSVMGFPKPLSRTLNHTHIAQYHD